MDKNEKNKKNNFSILLAGAIFLASELIIVYFNRLAVIKNVPIPIVLILFLLCARAIWLLKNNERSGYYLLGIILFIHFTFIYYLNKNINDDMNNKNVSSVNINIKKNKNVEIKIINKKEKRVFLDKKSNNEDKKNNILLTKEEKNI